MRFALALIAAFLVSAPALAGPPPAGVLVPGRSLGGIELGTTKALLERRWGRAYGVCKGCPHESWYFNEFAFQPRGAGVELRRGRVVAIFTLYQPLGWRTNTGLRLGDSAATITARYGSLVRRECGGYYVLERPTRQAVTGFYVLDEQLWAFGLSRPGISLCR
ncbi:MAG: hypothetical protein M3R12_00050 [Actinomycetota bacterium]|nr:hypothetical protein [Actinomycetota bacterium]